MIATNKEEIGIKPMDFYSIAHILMGMIAHIVGTTFALLFVPPYPANLIGIISAIVFSLMWEIFENNILIKTKYKNLFTPERKGRKDSLNNSLTDEVFVVLGTTIEFCLYLTGSVEIVFYANLGIINGLLWLFYYLRKRTIDGSS